MVSDQMCFYRAPISVFAGFQKFSIIHTLRSSARPIIAKWRPSGEGMPPNPDHPLSWQRTRALPRKSRYRSVEPCGARLETNKPFPSAAQSRVSKLFQPLTSISRTAGLFTERIEIFAPETLSTAMRVPAVTEIWARPAYVCSGSLDPVRVEVLLLVHWS
jgi:hypothetical protein